MATLTAGQRGWGDPDAKTYRSRNVVKVEAGGLTVYAHPRLAKLVAFLLAETVRRGYRLDLKADDWSYANRCIRGTGKGTGKPCVKSNHAWATAFDLNALDNPLTDDGRVHTNMPDWLVKLWAEWGFGWGGGYSHSRKDPMHFEFKGTPADADRLTAALARKQAAHRPDVRQRKPAPKKNPHTPQAAGTFVAEGAHGEHVEFIQWSVRVLEDGDFGPKTKDAVVAFQRAHGLDADGVVGPKTLAVLKRVTR